MRTHVPAALAFLCLAACGGKDSPSSPPAAPAAPSPAAAPADHGQVKDLGRLTVAGHEFSVIRLGEVVPGKEGAFEVSLVKGPPGADVAKLNLYAWVEEAGGAQVSAPAKGSLEGTRLHFHVTPRANAAAPTRVVLRLRGEGGIDERAGLPLDGHGHEHGATPHEGVLAAFRGPDAKHAGTLELKLHDDKGDLELWLAKDERMTKPFDLPLDATIRGLFVDVKDRTVDLRARNTAKNEDEDGTANVRDGKTNYFIFPGETGADASWLVGATFQSIVRVTFSGDGTSYASEEFMLVPHTHADGSTHK